jgi:hypothetical protein
MFHVSYFFNFDCFFQSPTCSILPALMLVDVCSTHVGEDSTHSVTRDHIGDVGR